MIKCSDSLSKVISVLDTWSIDLEINEKPNTLYAPINHLLFQKGKYIRSSLTLLSNHLFNDDSSGIKPIVLAIESLHGFTLIHDDVMDNATLRRGVPTINQKWSANQAILSGDVLMMRSFNYLLNVKNQNQDILKLFTQTAIKICEGQQIDFDMQHSKNITLDDYYHMIGLKTGVLIQFSLMAPCYLNKGGFKYLKTMELIGYYVGQLFQIQDDYLDLYGFEIGKEKGGDVRENKKTFLYTMALHVSSNKEKLALETIYHSTSKDKINQVVKIYKKLNLESIVTEKINNLKKEIFDLIDQINVSVERKNRLVEFIGLIINRKK